MPSISLLRFDLNPFVFDKARALQLQRTADKERVGATAHDTRWRPAVGGRGKPHGDRPAAPAFAVAMRYPRLGAPPNVLMKRHKRRVPHAACQFGMLLPRAQFGLARVLRGDPFRPQCLSYSDAKYLRGSPRERLARADWHLFAKSFASATRPHRNRETTYYGKSWRNISLEAAAFV
jgi:hypothetical protein